MILKPEGVHNAMHYATVIMIVTDEIIGRRFTQLVAQWKQANSTGLCQAPRNDRGNSWARNLGGYAEAKKLKPA
jgi:hypothetical protein